VSAQQEHGPEQTLPITNQQVAESLDELAGLLEAQGANMFRVLAYRTAAHNLRELPQSVAAILATQGVAGLLELPGIGHSIARSITKLCHTGRLPLLQRLQGESGPEHLFMTLPGIGPEFASRIHEQLGVESLPELEAAALDGRLAKVHGMGRKRILAIQEVLRGRFRRPLTPLPVPTHPATAEPGVEEILDVDHEYREKAAAGQLRLIAPRRLNPAGEAWLPVLHTHRADRQYTALYSNTARAHELGMTHDWVVVYRDDHDGHGQWTMITSRYGPLRGHRIVRGREAECADHYARKSQRPGPGTLQVDEPPLESPTGQG
jgi:Holliday junction resolvasome RuvABC DNA-binding subunit